MHGHNSATIDTADWAAEITRSKAHAYIKLIVHTLRVLIKAGEADIEISDIELSQMTSLSLKTVQRYRQLAKDEGWLDTKPGVGRSKVTTYRVSVPMQTLSELAGRLSALTKNQSDRPVINENRSGGLTAGVKPVSQTTIENENRSYSPIAGSEAENVPPHPPKNNFYNNTPLPPKRAKGRGCLDDPFGLNPHMRKQHEDVWFDTDDRLQVGNGFRIELEGLAGGPDQLRIELDRAAEWVGMGHPPPVLKAKVRGRIQTQISERRDKDRRYEKAKQQNDLDRPGPRSSFAAVQPKSDDIPDFMPRPREDVDA